MFKFWSYPYSFWDSDSENFCFIYPFRLFVDYDINLKFWIRDYLIMLTKNKKKQCEYYNAHANMNSFRFSLR